MAPYVARTPNKNNFAQTSSDLSKCGKGSEGDTRRARFARNSRCRTDANGTHPIQHGNVE